MAAPLWSWKFLGIGPQRCWQVLNDDLMPCVPRAYQGNRGLPKASRKSGYEMSSCNSRRQASGCLNTDNRNIPDSEGQSRKEKPEMPKKIVAGVTMFGLGSQLILNLSRVGGGKGAGREE